MRGTDKRQESLFSYVSPEHRVPKTHPLRPIRAMVDAALAAMDAEFEALYADEGRPSIPPEYLLRGSLLQIFYTIRSERLLMEQLDYNLLFRWFVGLSMDDKVWDHSTFSKNRDRLMDADIARIFFEQILAQAAERKLLSEDHFSVDGTLIEAWASMKSVRPKDEDDTPPSGRNPEVDFHGQPRKNDTHQSTTDPDARLYRKGKGREAKLCYMGHALMENRNGLVVDGTITQATGTAEREAALDMISHADGQHRITLGADKGYDTAQFVEDLRSYNITPHVAQNDTRRRSAIDQRTTRHAGYATSMRKRKRIEEIFGWVKTVGGLRKTRFIGPERINFQLLLTFAGFNLVRMRNIALEVAG